MTSCVVSSTDTFRPISTYSNYTPPSTRPSSSLPSASSTSPTNMITSVNNKPMQSIPRKRKIVEKHDAKQSRHSETVSSSVSNSTDKQRENEVIKPFQFQ